MTRELRSLAVKPLAAIIFSLTSAITTHSAMAQQMATINQQQQTGQLEEVVVTANRNLLADGGKMGIVLINQSQIEAQQPQSIAQALKYEPNLTVEGGPRAGNQAPNIRGLSTVRVLQSIDGARQNFNSGHRGSYQLDPELLKQIEVKKGPASSLWGSGAIGGVVALSTKNAQDLLGDEKQLGGYLKQGYASNGNGRRTSAAIFGKTYSNDGQHQGLDYLINGVTSDSDDLTLGNGEKLEKSASKHNAWLAKAGWNPAQGHRLEVSFRHNNRDELTPSNPGVSEGETPLIQRDSTDQNITANYWLEAFAGKHSSRLTLYQNQTKFDEFRIALNQQDKTEVDTTGLALVNTSEGFGGQWTYGFDVYQDQIDTLRAGDERPADLNAEHTTLGLFAELALSLSENLKLSPGLRYDRFRAENQQNAPHDNSAVSPSITLDYQLTDWLNLNIGYAKAFRAPNVEELYADGTHFCMRGACSYFIPNPDLNVEEAANTTIGANGQFADLWWSGDQLSLDATVFRNKIDQFIELQPISFHPKYFFPTKFSNLNVDKAQIEGFELAGRYWLNDLELSLSYGQSRGIDLSDNSHLNNIPADKWVLNIGHYFLQKHLKLGLNATHTSAQNKTTAEYPDPFAGYTLTDIYATWEAARGNMGALKLGLSLNNLTDEYYRVAFQDLYMPGRNIQFSVNYSF
ncbi:MAG: TonB-dependent hemoglobin/transferrin/lactoferrin family receptor [Gammaproteobacteria bacterium]|nr:TonB-dependent hemoglobin/transferrin/lactoferrin family receptor [Gammaproteobacteria bacterium]